MRRRRWFYPRKAKRHARHRSRRQFEDDADDDDFDVVIGCAPEEPGEGT